MARALAELPLISDAMRRGTVSYAKVRAITRVAMPETEQRLLDGSRCICSSTTSSRTVRASRGSMRPALGWCPSR